MRKTIPIIILFILLLWKIFPVSAQVQTQLKVFEASNVGKGMDPSLKDMGSQFKSLFSFSSYRLLKEETLTLFPNQPARVSIPPDRTIELILTGLQKNAAEVVLKMRQEKAIILDTKVRLLPGKTVSIGGPKYGQGVILIALSALF